MGLTVDKILQARMGHRKAIFGDVHFDNSYASGGEEITPAMFGLMHIDEVLIESQNRLGYNISHYPNYSDGKHYLKVFNSAQPPPIVVEEAVTVASNAGKLAYAPLYIVAIQVTAGSTTGAFKVIPTGETPLTTQCAVTFPTGALTFLGTDAVTAAKVTYIPKRGGGYLSSVTVDETITASATPVSLAARAGLIQYVWDDTDGVLATLEPSGEQPSATHKAVVDINNSSATKIDSHADDATNTLKVTYVPYSQLPPGTFIDDTDITLSSEVWNFTGDPTVLGYNKLVVPGSGCVLVGETGAAANQEAVWQGPSGTAANNVAVWNPATNSIVTNQDTAMATTAISWMILDVDQLTLCAGNEVAALADLSALTDVRVCVVGY